MVNISYGFYIGVHRVYSLGTHKLLFFFWGGEGGGGGLRLGAP